MSQEPRECDVQFSIIGNPLFSETVRMIERSAYDALKSELAQCAAKLKFAEAASLEAFDKYWAEFNRHEATKAELAAARAELGACQQSLVTAGHVYLEVCQTRDALKAEVERLTETVTAYQNERYPFAAGDLVRKIMAYEEECARLEAALEFYADDTYWQQGAVKDDKGEHAKSTIANHASFKERMK